MNIGVISYGARRDIANEANRPELDIKITAIFDPSERARNDAQKDHPQALVTNDIEIFLASNIDAVMILAPDYLHAKLAKKTLSAGIPTFCEKPLAIDLNDADEILETAYKYKTKLYIGHNMRHMPVITMMRDLILAGKIGEVKSIWCRHFVGHGGDYYFKDWHADRSKTNGLLLQKAVHDIDVIHWLASSYTNKVSAIGSLSLYGNITDRKSRENEIMRDWFSLDNWPPKTQKGLNSIIDVEDLSLMNMKLKNGVLASYQQCHYTPDYWRNYTIIGDAGRIENFGDDSGSKVKIWNRRSRGYAEANEEYTVPYLEGDHSGGDKLLIDEFIRFINHGGATSTSPVAARNAVAAGILATKSIRSDGGLYEVPALPDYLLEYFSNGQPGSKNLIS